MRRHPSTWKIRPAGAEPGKSKSCSLLLPMGQGTHSVKVSTAAVRGIWRLVNDKSNEPETAGEMAQAIRDTLLLAEKLFNIKQVSKNTAAALDLWFDHYQSAVTSYAEDEREALKEVAKPEQEPKSSPVPERHKRDREGKDSAQQPLEQMYEILKSVREGGTVGCAKGLEQIIVEIEQWSV